MQVSEIIGQKNWMKLALSELDERTLSPSEINTLLEAIEKEKLSSAVAMRQAEAIREKAYTKGQEDASFFERKRLALKALKETEWSIEKIGLFFEIDIKEILENEDKPK